MTELTRFLKKIKKANLTQQQYSTLKGQAIKGDIVGAKKGLQRIKGGKHTEHFRKNGTHIY